MKRCLLAAMLLFVFYNNARADIQFIPSKITVREYYYLKRKPDLNPTEFEWDISVRTSGYLLGILEFNVIKSFANNNMEMNDCINKPLIAWEELVFDNYKLNRIKGDVPLFSAFIKTINEVCKIDLFGINEVENNKTTKPIPKPSSSYKVSEVTDGDTVKIDKRNEIIKARLAD